MKLAVIVLNWNEAEDTIRCIRYISAWEQIQAAIWVVDNGSTDGSPDVIARECPQVTLIRNEANMGFGAGMNQGIERALLAGNAPILLLNNDALVDQVDIVRLIETLEADENIGFIGPCLYDADKQKQLLAAGGRSPVLHHHSHMPAPPTDEPVYPVMYVPGTVVIGRAEVFRAAGLLDEAYFFSIDMPDICIRAEQHGYRNVIDRRARAYHALGRSSKKRETVYAYYTIRNRFLFMRKHHRWHIWLYAFWTLYSLALTLKLRLSGKSYAAQGVWLGLLDGWRGRFGGQNERILPAIFPELLVANAVQQEAES